MCQSRSDVSRVKVRSRAHWGLALFLALSCGAAEPPLPPSRGVALLPASERPLLSSAPTDSVGLFVGVQELAPGAKIEGVPYAVDDAVDLAYLLSLPKDRRRQLLLPRHVHLALRGEPRKPESKLRLAELLAAGAHVSGASRAEIARWLTAPGVGAPALLWVSFATHGLTLGRDEYLLTADSRLEDLAATALLTQFVLEQVARRPAALRLVVLDACRELLSAESGRKTPLRTLSALDLAVNEESNGPLAVLRARVGGPLFDDQRRRQGVFTAALLDGLACRAPTDDHGHVTLAFLAEHANRQVVEWTKEHLRMTAAEMGIETHLGGTAATQPLVPCHECPRAEQPDHLAIKGGRLEVFAADGRLLWTHTAAGTIAQAEIADLDGDGSRDVVLGVSVDGPETGWIKYLNCRGNEVWRFNTWEPSPYGAYSGRMDVRKLVVADLFGDKSRQVIAISTDAQAWLPSRLTLLDAEGHLRGSYWHPGHLAHLDAGSASATSPARIVAAGVNNNLRAFFPGNDFVVSVFLLDPRNVRGQAPPYLPGGEPGSQLWYRAIVPQDPKILSPGLLRLDDIQILDADHDGKREIHVRMTEGHSMLFDFRGCPIQTRRGDGARGDVAAAAIGDDFRGCRQP